MKVVMTIAALNPEHGGPARTLSALCRALVDLGVEIEVITVAEPEQPNDVMLSRGLKVTSVATSARRYHPRLWRKAFKSALSDALSGRSDVVLYDLGLWLPSHHLAVEMAVRTETPLVISPRGMLSQEALEISRWKKRFAWNLYQRRDLQRASVLHATSEREAEGFRALNLSTQVVVVPNGVELPPKLVSRVGSPGKIRTLLFLSRLHPIKGLKDLINAWASIRPSGWRVVVAGPNENNHRQEVELLTESLEVRGDFEFVGSVDDLEKWNLLAKADLFVLPSHSESFGLAIAEALAAGLPVITTRATPWGELVTHRCGWWVDVGVEPLRRALSDATTRTTDELAAMGARGSALVIENYSWPTVAKKMLGVFEWLVEQRDEPPELFKRTMLAGNHIAGNLR